MAALVVVLVLLAAGLAALSMQVRCIDAAREAARLTARGDPAAGRSAGLLAPAGSRLEIWPDGGYVVARVTGRSALLPGLAIVGRAVAALEPGP